MSINRETLIEAAASAHERKYNATYVGKEATYWASHVQLATAVLDAVLPLIAEAIEAERQRHISEYGPLLAGQRHGMKLALDVVRSLTQEQP